MGISIIISNANNEVMETEYFVDQLRRKWSGVSIHFNTDPDSPILQFKTADVLGILGQFTGSGVSYKGYSQVDNAQFALWYRSISPDHWTLRIYDSAMTFDFIFLTKESTERQILDGFNIPFDISKYE